MLPKTPDLPDAAFSGIARINGINLWYALFGPPIGCGRNPVVFLHGGKINSNWWGVQIKYVADKGYPVIALDTRGHGRSSDDDALSLSYDLFADDTAALLAYLKVPRASFVGWSDGANTSLSLAMRYGDKVDRAFVFGANYHSDQANVEGLSPIPFLEDVKSRMKAEYEALSPNPDKFEAFMAKMALMQGTLPKWDGESFAQIKTRLEDPIQAPIMWIGYGELEEYIPLRVFAEMRDMIQGSSLIVMPQVGHFAPLQHPDIFNALLDRWLEDARQ